MEPRPASTDDRRPDAVPAAPASVFEVAPAEDLLYSMSADGKRRYLHPQLHKGRFWKVRLALAWALVALFVALPLVPVGGRPAVLLDLVGRRFHVLGATFHPTDNLLLAALGVGLVVTLFFVGSTFGRLWCGYACPQTVFLEFLFRPVEMALEGKPHQQRQLALAPWGPRKVALVAAKWTVWAVIAVGMAATLVAYFVGWAHLAGDLLAHPLAHTGVLGVVAFLTVAILFDFGWFRDQMCTLACPYGRLQNVMADPDTILVAYDERRGEPRAPLGGRHARLETEADERTRKEAHHGTAARVRPGVLDDRLPDSGRTYGDCVDCRLCVSTCPTGVDIRRGLQLECIGCTQCIDACDMVMTRIGKPRGLIRHTSERALAGGGRRFWRPRIVVYLVLLALSWGTLAALVVGREEALVEVLRGGREPYRILPDGQVANQQRFRFTNQLPTPQVFTVEVVAPPGASLVLGGSPVVVEPAKLATANAVTTVGRGVFVDGQLAARYLVRSDRGFRKEVDFLLLGPEQGDGR